MPVAFDAATSAQATGVSSISLSHTASGVNRGAFIGVGSSSGAPQLTTSVTYAGGGGAVTEQWDEVVFEGIIHNSGHTLPNPATGAQTVTATLAGIDDEVVLGVISFTDVHQTTPVGTAPTPAEGVSTTATVTVAGVGADDMVVSHLHSGWLGTTPGADETERWEQIIGTIITGAGNTQLGSAGGVMSMTQVQVGFSDDWVLGAIAFKPTRSRSHCAPVIG